MVRTKLAVCSLLIVLYLSGHGSRVEADHCNVGILDPCLAVVTAAPGLAFACPQGDGDPLDASGLTITVTALDCHYNPIAGIPASDFWLIGCNDLLSLCGGSGAINATGPTDENGQTTITGDIAAGGCDVSGVRVVMQGVVLGAGVCGQPCIPIKVKSPDLNGNLVVNLVDFAIFGAGYTSPPNSYNECIDYTAPFGTVTLADFATYAVHSGHTC